MPTITPIPSQPTLVPYRKNLDYMITYNDIVYTIAFRDVKKTAKFVVVPKDFITDGASVPYGARWIIGQPFWPRFQVASLLHDYLYVVQTNSRKEADEWFLELLKINGVGAIRRAVMFLAVRGFGWHAWAKRRKKLMEARNNGE